jgi:hypothetical protein
MYCNPIGQSYNPENTIAEFCDLSPETDSSITLNLDAKWILDNFNAPLTFDVWTLTQDFILKTSSVLVLWHDLIICQSSKDCQSLTPELTRPRHE